MTSNTVFSSSSDESFWTDVALVIVFVIFESLGALGDFPCQATVNLKKGSDEQCNFDGDRLHLNIYRKKIFQFL